MYLCVSVWSEVLLLGVIIIAADFFSSLQLILLYRVSIRDVTVMEVWVLLLISPVCYGCPAVSVLSEIVRLAPATQHIIV